MENITDALKMAAAALIFIVAFSVTMVMFSQARETTDKIVGSINSDDYLPKVEGLGNNITREVGIEPVIPTLYRYAQSDDNIQIRIVSEIGEELQVFDTNIESQISKITLDSKSNDYDYLNSINSKYNDETKKAYMFGAPWYNQGSSYILERINAYIYGKKMKHFPKVDYTNKEYLMKYADASKYKFEETYLEYRTDGVVFTDEYGEEIVTRPASTKIVITYKIKRR